MTHRSIQTDDIVKEAQSGTIVDNAEDSNESIPQHDPLINRTDVHNEEDLLQKTARSGSNVE